MNARFQASLFPNPGQEMLLRAALATDGRAGEHFRRWLEIVPFEGQHDAGSYRLLSLLWTTLSNAGVEHPHLGRLKGVFRNNWVKASQRLALATDLLHMLGAAGIRTLVGKGLPLALAYYETAAHRPMNDVDIVVAADDAPLASRLLEQRGFLTDRGRWSSERRLRHALLHQHPKHGEVDLHWHVLFDCPNEAADRPFWQHAASLSVGAAETLRPSATELLLQVVVHGMRPNALPPIRWVADAAMVIRSGDEIDWSRLADFAREQGVATRVALGLSYLQRTFDIAVPDHLLGELGARPSLFERVELLAMGKEIGQRRWRHLRRGTHIVRLLRSDRRPWSLSLALVREFYKRYLRATPRGLASPAGGRHGG